MTVTRDVSVYQTTLEGEVFGTALTGVDYVKALCPDIDPATARHLDEATRLYGWTTVKDYDEHMLFLQQYMQIKHQVYREAVEVGGDPVGGLSAFNLYDRYQKIVEAAVLKITNWGDLTGDFLGHIARTATTTQWIVRQMSSDTFYNGINQCIPQANYNEVLTAGSQLLVPRVGSGQANCVTYNDEQMYLIFYYRSDLNPRGVEYIQETVNDDWGQRPPMDVYAQSQKGNMGIITRPGCLVVDDNTNYFVGGYPVGLIEHDFMPQGIDLITRNQVHEL